MDEKKRLWCCLIVLCFLTFIWQKTCLASELQSVTVTVCGEAELSNSESYLKALEDAKQKAVKKVFARVINQPQALGTVYQHVLENHKHYVVDVKVIKEEEIRDMLYLVSKVKVNMQKLEKIVKDFINGEKQLETDHTVYFFIRAKGFDSEIKENNAQLEIAQIYNDSFQSFGFEMANEDTQSRLISQHRNLPFGGYVKAMEQTLNDHVEVILAVIGEIEVNPLVEDSVGYSVESLIRIKAIDLINNKVITEFNDSYQLRRSSKEEAYKFILDKSAFNSSKILASSVLEYWKINRYQLNKNI